jgi:hypothetical protein
MKTTDNEKADSKPEKSVNRKWWGSIFWVLFGVVSLKVALTFGIFCGGKETSRAWLSTPSVLEEKKAALLECEKAVKMLECLEEADRLSYRHLQSQKEQKDLDEISILKGFHEND